MSDFLQLTDAGCLFPRQYSSMFGRQESSISSIDPFFYKSGPILNNQHALMRQSSIDALFAPINHSAHIFRSPSMASDSMIQSSIDEASTDYTYKPSINQFSGIRHVSAQDDVIPNQPPMLPHSPASSASTSSASSPSHEYEQSPLISRELTGSNAQFPQPSVRYQFNYTEPESSELDDSEFEFSPITQNRQVWSTPSQRRTLADSNHLARQRSASGELAFSAHQQAMIHAWSNAQAKLVHLPPTMQSTSMHPAEASMEQLSSYLSTNQRAFVPDSNSSSLNIRPADQPKQDTLFSHPLLPPGVDPNEIVVGTYTRAERAMKIARYREKRARRKWTKKIMYDCRKSFADNRPRVGGRFIKMKEPKSE